MAISREAELGAPSVLPAHPGAQFGTATIYLLRLDQEP